MTTRLAVVGHPVKHSLSPAIFRSFSASAGRRLRYGAVDIPPQRLSEALRRAPRRGWTGWNVTLPHKVAVMGALDAIDASARAVGAVNVVAFRGGRSVGYNTDAEGFLVDLKSQGFDPRGRRAVVLGAGGAARAVCSALRAAEVAGLRVLSRTPARAQELGETFGGAAGPITSAGLSGAELVVNASSAGLDGAGSPLPPGVVWPAGAFAYDLVYRPARTPFLEAALAAGARGAGGLGMLIAQAAAAWRLWFDEELPPRALVEARKELSRILFDGGDA